MISIIVFDRDGEFSHSFVNLNSYSHTITDGIGFDNMTFETHAGHVVGDYFLSMIGKWIVATSHTWGIFEGFINQVGVTRGPYYSTIGPLDNINNKVCVSYADYDSGEKSFTSPVQDDDSISRYGTFYRIVSSGKIPSTLADSNALTALEEQRYPELTDSFQQNEGSTVKVDVLGFAHMLKQYPYNNASDGTVYSHQLVQDVLEAQPESIFSTDYSRFLSPTSLSVETLHEDYKTADAVIKDAIEIGNDNNAPVSFGIYNGRKAWFVAPNETAEELGYFHIPGEGFVRSFSGQIVRPEFIRPGRVFSYSGISKRSRVRGAIGDNSTIIRGVTFTAPDQFTINGSTGQTLSQKLAKQRGF